MKNLAAVYRLSAALIGYHTPIFQGEAPEGPNLTFFGSSRNFSGSVQALLAEMGKKINACETTTVLLSPNCLPLLSQIP